MWVREEGVRKREEFRLILAAVKDRPNESKGKQQGSSQKIELVTK